ncbi:hypothetical protein LT493_02060 [Streptomyces tricolor]|nr:hypothetical protein [Streptomyces tricolor]
MRPTVGGGVAGRRTRTGADPGYAGRSADHAGGSGWASTSGWWTERSSTSWHPRAQAQPAGFLNTLRLGSEALAIAAVSAALVNLVRKPFDARLNGVPVVRRQLGPARQQRERR